MQRNRGGASQPFHPRFRISKLASQTSTTPHCHTRTNERCAEFVEHYHRERNHQGVGNRLITSAPASDTTGRVRRRPRLGGLLNFYVPTRTDTARRSS